MKINFFVSTFIIWIFFILFSPQNSLAISETQAEISKQIIVKTNWGKEKAEIGSSHKRGSGTPGKSINPIAVDSKENIYIGDSINYRIQKFDSKGIYISDLPLQKFVASPSSRHIISDIKIDKNDNIYVVFYDTEKIGKFTSDGRLLNIYNLNGMGMLTSSSDGTTKLSKNEKIRIQRIILDDLGNIYGLCGHNLMKINNSGKLVQRWGPSATNAKNFFFVDKSNTIYIWMSPEEKGSMYKRYDKEGKYLGSGLGLYNGIVEPFYTDANGSVYGFENTHANSEPHFIKYSPKEEKIYKLPLDYIDIAHESWTIDAAGNIYYTESESDKFLVIKLSIVSQKNNAK